MILGAIITFLLTTVPVILPDVVNAFLPSVDQDRLSALVNDANMEVSKKSQMIQNMINNLGSVTSNTIYRQLSKQAQKYGAQLDKAQSYIGKVNAIQNKSMQYDQARGSYAEFGHFHTANNINQEIEKVRGELNNEKDS